jgi:fumarate reductase subunit C
MITDIAYLSFLGNPLVVWLGILSLFVLLLTAAAPKLFWRGKRLISHKGHVRLAYVTIAAAVLHGILGLASRLGF